MTAVEGRDPEGCVTASPLEANFSPSSLLAAAAELVLRVRGTQPAAKADDAVVVDTVKDAVVMATTEVVTTTVGGVTPDATVVNDAVVLATDVTTVVMVTDEVAQPESLTSCVADLSCEVGHELVCGEECVTSKGTACFDLQVVSFAS